MSSSSSSDKTSLKYCSCLNVRVTLTYPDTEPTEEPIHPSFKWCWLSTNQGVQIQHSSLTLRHHWDENWIALRCLNCNTDVYVYDVDDSYDSTESLRPVLYNQNLITEKEAELIQCSDISSNSLEGEVYSPAFKVITSSSGKASTLNPVASSNTLNVLEFQKQLDLFMDSYMKREETAMQLRIEEFREEQQRLLEFSINAAQLASSRLFQIAQLNQPNVSETRNPFASNSPESLSVLKDMSLDDFDEVIPGQDPPQQDNSDDEDFSEDAQEVPLKQKSTSSDNMGYLSSSFNEDMFDLDEDYSRSVSSPTAQEPHSVPLVPDSETSNVIVGSFAAQGRHFLSTAPKFIPDSSHLSARINSTEDSDNSQLENNVDLSDMMFSSSLPISIHPRNQNSRPIKVKPEHSAAFEAPHEMASRTYANDKDQLFGGVPRSVTRRLGI